MKDFDYDQWAPGVLERKNRDQVLAWKAEEMEALAGPNANFQSILEIGCAEGLVLDHIRRHFNIKECHGIDVSETFLALARERFPDIAFLLTRGSVLPFADRTIDLIVVSDLLEHVQDLGRMMAEIRRVGRRVLVKVPIEKFAWRTMVSKPLGRSPSVGLRHPDGHLRECSRRGWLSIFRKAGFRALESRVIYYEPTFSVPRTSGFIRARWLLDLALKKRFPRFAHLFFGGNLVAYLENSAG